MKKVYHLASCTTCQRILKEVGKVPGMTLQDIKTEPITEQQLDEMASRSGSYESLFSRVALKYRALKLNEKKLSEKDYRRHILQEYTFLKRPVFLIGDDIFIGNAPKTVEAVKQAVKKMK